MKLAVCTLGCKVNAYESEFAIKEFKKLGYEIVDFDSYADVYLINTCTVTNTSDQKSRKMIRQARKKNKDAVVAVMGCYTQIRKNNDHILDVADIIIGNTNKSNIANLVTDYIKNKNKILKVENISEAKFEDMNLEDFSTKTRAFVKIEDGCENFCTYCIIPYARGKVRSKKKENILKEVKSLVAKGHKEIVLTGIHTGHYGADLEDYDFSDLLLDLEKIEGLDRIRISSIEITELNDKFLDVLKKSKKIVNHLHIPLQAGSDHILKLMNRKYDLSYFTNKINKIREIRPLIAITTDVIVGFPKETSEDFCATIEYVNKIKFAGGHVFPYSIREGTPAAKMDGQLTKEQKHERSKKLIREFEKLEEEYYKKFINNKMIVIPEKKEEGYLTGHTDNYLKVKIEGCENLIGKEILVKILKYEDKVLIGKIVS